MSHLSSIDLFQRINELIANLTIPMTDEQETELLTELLEKYTELVRRIGRLADQKD